MPAFRMNPSSKTAHVNYFIVGQTGIPDALTETIDFTRAGVKVLRLQ